MPEDGDAASLCRAKADEVNAAAAQMTDPRAFLTLLKIAEGYEHLAELVEKQADRCRRQSAGVGAGFGHSAKL